MALTASEMQSNKKIFNKLFWLFWQILSFFGSNAKKRIKKTSFPLWNKFSTTLSCFFDTIQRPWKSPCVLGDSSNHWGSHPYPSGGGYPSFFLSPSSPFFSRLWSLCSPRWRCQWAWLCSGPAEWVWCCACPGGSLPAVGTNPASTTLGHLSCGPDEWGHLCLREKTAPLQKQN